MGRARIEFHYEAFDVFRQAMQPEIDARGQAIADAAGGEDAGMVYESRPNATRARGIVITATYKARRAEARNGDLTRAIGAGRD